MRPALTQTQRLAAARLSGAIGRLTMGGLNHLPREQKLTHLRAITTDPRVLGQALGAFLEPESTSNLEAVSLLRELSADEEHARQVAEDLRKRNWGRQREG